MSRRRQRVKISCEELRSFYIDNEMSQAQIAAAFGTTRQTISNKMKACGIDARTKSKARKIALREGRLFGTREEKLVQCLRIAMAYRPLETDPMQVAFKQLAPDVVEEFQRERRERKNRD